MTVQAAKAGYGVQIKQRALKTMDPQQLQLMVYEAVNWAEQEAATAALSRVREQKLKEQIERLMALNKNLENTLWNRK